MFDQWRKTCNFAKFEPPISLLHIVGCSSEIIWKYVLSTLFHKNLILRELYRNVFKHHSKFSDFGTCDVNQKLLTGLQLWNTFLYLHQRQPSISMVVREIKVFLNFHSNQSIFMAVMLTIAILKHLNGCQYLSGCHSDHRNESIPCWPEKSKYLNICHNTLYLHSCHGHHSDKSILKVALATKAWPTLQILLQTFLFFHLTIL